MKPLDGIQRVQVPSGQRRADRPVASVAIHRATGGCEAYTARKQAVKIQLRNLILVAMPTPLALRKAVSGPTAMRGRAGVAGVPSSGHASHGFPRNPRELPISSPSGRYRPPRETGGGREWVAEQSYRLIVPMKVGNRRAPAGSGHDTHWREGGARVDASGEGTISETQSSV